MPNQNDSMWTPELLDRGMAMLREHGTINKAAAAMSREVGFPVTYYALRGALRSRGIKPSDVVSGGIGKPLAVGQGGAAVAMAGVPGGTGVLRGADGGLAEKLKKLLLKEALTVPDLADRLDVAPKRVRSVVEELTGAGFNVAIHEGDGSDARLMIETGVGMGRDIRLDAEKFYDPARGECFAFEFGCVSDTHLGSKFFRPEVLQALYDNFALHGIKHVFHGGNYIEGEKHDKFSLIVHGMQGQIDYFLEHYPQREGMTTYFIAGDDHEGWYQQREGIDIGRFTESEARRQGRNDLVNLGYMEADVGIKAPNGTCKLRVMHAGGGSAYAISYTAQKIIEAMEGGEKPSTLLIGHFHKSEYLPAYRNVHCVQMGTTKGQDVFMRKNRLAAHIGGWRCRQLIDKNGVVVEMTATYLPFFNQGYYESMAIDATDGRVQFHGANETYNVVH